MEPQVTAAWITGSCTIAATFIAACTAGLIGKWVQNRKQLERDLQTAIGDIAFLLEVEAIHCARHKQDVGESFKNRIRNEAEKNPDLNWSGAFTRGRSINA